MESLYVFSFEQQPGAHTAQQAAFGRTPPTLRQPRLTDTIGGLMFSPVFYHDNNGIFPSKSIM